MDERNRIKSELKKRLLARLPREGSYATDIDGVRIHRKDTAKKTECCFYQPRIIKMIQGSKHSLVGEREYQYGEDDILIIGVDIPNTSRLLEASPEKPAMSMTVDLDKNLIAQLALEMSADVKDDTSPISGVVHQPAEAVMLDAFLRLEGLLDSPKHISILAPMVIREIHYRALMGPKGSHLLAFHTLGTQKNQIACAITWLKDNFKEPLDVESLADRVHMSSATFHRHFKDVATISPLQFQKRLRLHEAQRLMIMNDLAATSACDAVGYESLTQFNREYKRLFGEPPLRDVNRWRREHASSLSYSVGV